MHKEYGQNFGKIWSPYAMFMSKVRLLLGLGSERWAVYKCRQCKHRYAFKSIWDSLRLSHSEKKESNYYERMIRQHTKPGSLYYTDDWHAYASLGLSGACGGQKREGHP